MKVSEFIEWLGDRDQNATIRVLVSGYKGYYVVHTFKEFDPDVYHYEGQNKEGQSILDLGE